jgi:dGTPase
LRVVEKLEYEGKGLNLTFEVRDGIQRHSKGRGEIFDDDLGDMPSTLEGQIVRVSDIIAYVNHDIDDASRAGIIKEVDIPAGLIKVLGKWHATRIDRMVMDVVEASLGTGLDRIAMSDRIMKAVLELREFLYQNVYFNSTARDELRKTEKIIGDIFAYIMEKPEEYVKDYPAGDPVIVRAGDFIAGMTDRYAMALYEQLFLPKSWPIL